MGICTLERTRGTVRAVRLGALAAVVVAFLPCTPRETARAQDVLLQSESRERFGEKDFAYFFIEAEDYYDNNPRAMGESWLLSSDPAAVAAIENTVAVDPDTGELLEPDPWAFASGGESITNAVFQSLVSDQAGGGHDIQYIVQFDTPGVYYLYIRQHSPVGPDLDRNKHDSFYYPTEFGEDPVQYKANGDDYGILESVQFEGDVATRGPWVWLAARTMVENGEQNPLSDQNAALFREYEITDDMVGEELILEFDHRETGAMLDSFLFIEATSGLPPTNGLGPDGLGFFGVGDLVDEEFGLENLVPGAGPEPSISFVRGDCNADGSTNITDGVFLLNYLFLGGTTPVCMEACNPDGGVDVNISDGISILNFLFLGGPAPVAPYPDCGEDETEVITCEAAHPGCI